MVGRLETKVFVQHELPQWLSCTRSVCCSGPSQTRSLLVEFSVTGTETVRQKGAERWYCVASCMNK